MLIQINNIGRIIMVVILCPIYVFSIYNDYRCLYPLGNLCSVLSYSPVAQLHLFYCINAGKTKDFKRSGSYWRRMCLQSLPWNLYFFFYFFFEENKTLFSKNAFISKLLKVFFFRTWSKSQNTEWQKLNAYLISYLNKHWFGKNLIKGNSCLYIHIIFISDNSIVI